MMTRTILAGAAALLVAGPAYASHCPMDAAAIDHALSVLEVSDEVRTEVQALRDEGMELHEAGNHEESEDKLSEAMRTLLNGVEKRAVRLAAARAPSAGRGAPVEDDALQKLQRADVLRLRLLGVVDQPGLQHLGRHGCRHELRQLAGGDAAGCLVRAIDRPARPLGREVVPA